MKHRILLIALALMLTLSLCACGAQRPEADFATKESITEPMVNGAGATFALRQSTTADAAPAEKSAVADTAAAGAEVPAPQQEKIIYYLQNKGMRVEEVSSNGH